MGQVSEWEPPAEEETFYKNLLRILDEVYPGNWREWVVNTPTYTDLFGDAISSDLECRLRFAVPTIRLAQAHSQTEATLSERRYRKIKRILINWPIGRALIYTPLSLMAKVHPVHPGNKFSDAVGTIKGELIPRHEASKVLRSHCGRESESASTVSSRRTSKRSHSPDPPYVTKEPRMSEFMEQQNALLGKLCQLVQTTNENVNTMLSKGETSCMSAFPQHMLPPSVQCENSEERETLSEDDSVDESWHAPSLGHNQFDDEEENTAEPLQDFTPGTKETEGKVTKADDTLIKQACDCQRFNSDGWQNIRYADVQKTFQATPAFTSLKVNGNLATVTPAWQLVSVLERTDLSLAAITHGLLQQRQTFQELYKNAPPTVKSHISKHFLAPESTFRKTSDSLLQYVCGKRAEIIQQRRGIYKPQNRTLNELLHAIPPSETHLFAEPQLSELVKEQGGVTKLFPNKRRTIPASTFTNRPTPRDKRFVPVASTSDNRDRPLPTYNQRSTINRKADRPRFQNKRVTRQTKNKKW